MERTTIYIDNKIKKLLFELSYKESASTGQRIGMVHIMREALKEYLEKRNLYIENEEDSLERMLKTKGTMSKSFEKRVKEAKKEFNKWKIKSV